MTLSLKVCFINFTWIFSPLDTVYLNIVNISTHLRQVSVESNQPDVAEPQTRAILLNTQNVTDGTWSSAFNVSANFIGYAEVKMRLDSEYPLRTRKILLANLLTYLQKLK
jgi:hypothetical protein